MPANIRDDAGRTLENAKRFPLEVGTDELPPLAKFPGAFGIIELNAGAVLPVTLRNLEASVQMRRLGPGTAEANSPGNADSLTQSKSPGTASRSTERCAE
jgi:hypothetical protein